MPQTRFAQTVCHFSHNADFDQLRISKYPANAHEINYFSMLVVGFFKYTGRDLFDLVLLFVHVLLSCEVFLGHEYAKIPIHISQNSIDAGNLEFWFIAVNGANGNDLVKKMKHSILSHIDTLP